MKENKKEKVPIWMYSDMVKFLENADMSKEIEKITVSLPADPCRC